MLFVLGLVLGLSGCTQPPNEGTAVAQSVERQQSQYGKIQPVPAFDWSIERDLIIQLYQIRNMRVVTHSVWRSDYGLIEGDCPSIGFGLPYDTSLTNPLVATNQSLDGYKHDYSGGALTSIEQAEPNGIFASKNTSATWVMCAGDAGDIDPIYVESNVSVYPYPVTVDYEKTRVTKSGKSSVTLTMSK